MVQPYVQEIETLGERALVFFGGAFLHAIHKGPNLHSGVRYDERREPHVGVTVWEPTHQELELAEQALATAPHGDELLYARVDIVGDPKHPAVIELELIEPNLFLRVHPESTSRVVEALLSAGRGALSGRRLGACHGRTSARERRI